MSERIAQWIEDHEVAGSVAAIILVIVVVAICTAFFFAMDPQGLYETIVVGVFCYIFPVLWLTNGIFDWPP